MSVCNIICNFVPAKLFILTLDVWMTFSAFESFSFSFSLQEIFVVDFHILYIVTLAMQCFDW